MPDERTSDTPPRRRIGSAVAILFVVFVYAFFAGSGRFSYTQAHWLGGSLSPAPPEGEPRGSLYAALSDGFLRGQTSLPLTPDPRLTALPNPYDIDARGAAQAQSMWDVSLFRGRYYLYFTPIPALVFYIPVRLLTGTHPSDALAALFFCAWSFLAAAAFLWRVLGARRNVVPLPLWILLAGFGNVIVYLMTDIRIYEVAIMAGMAMTMTWAWAFLRFYQSPSWRTAALTGLWLGLAIAARPNVAVLLPFAALAVLAVRDRAARIRVALAMLGPLVAIALALMTYNYVRFGNVLEFGVRYQMTMVDMKDHPVCRLCAPSEWARLANSTTHYLFWAPTVGSEFPFVDLQRTRLDPAVSYPGEGEYVLGIAALVPLTMIGALAALALMLRRNGAPQVLDRGTQASVQLMASSWLVLLGLASCWWVTARYALDFMMPMTLASAVCIEEAVARLRTAGFDLRPIRVLLISLALYSILLGVFLGFMGPAAAFRRVNPKLFQKLDRLLAPLNQAPAAAK